MKHRMNSGQTTRNMVWAIVALVGLTLAAVVVLVTFAPAGEDRRAVVLQILAMLAPTLAVLVTLQQVGQMRGQVAEVARDTHDLTNGLLDAKVRTGVADVLHPNLVDPTVTDQVEEDRDRIASRDPGEWPERPQGGS